MTVNKRDERDEPQSEDGSAGFVVIAEVVKAVGLKGELKLYPLLDWYPPLLESEFLRWEGGQSLHVRASRLDGSKIIIAIVGCENRTRAEALIGNKLGFLRADYEDPEFPRPPGGLPFRFLEREVRTVSGDVVGRVEEVRRYAHQITLVVTRDGREVLIPALEPILQPDSGLRGPLVIDPPDGLLDVAGD